jgi:hypothetical protein
MTDKHAELLGKLRQVILSGCDSLTERDLGEIAAAADAAIREQSAEIERLKAENERLGWLLSQISSSGRRF